MAPCKLLIAALCASLVGAFAPPRAAPARSLARRDLFGGGGADEGGGALSNVAGVMDQFKKAQEIAKKSQELQTELAAAEFEGASADGSVTFKMNGQQQPVSAAAPGFDGKSAEDLSKAFDSWAEGMVAKAEGRLGLATTTARNSARGLYDSTFLSLIHI